MRHYRLDCQAFPRKQRAASGVDFQYIDRYGRSTEAVRKVSLNILSADAIAFTRATAAKSPLDYAAVGLS